MTVAQYGAVAHTRPYLGKIGIRGRERLVNAASYLLLLIAIAIVFFPLAWMLTVSVRPNIEVMRMPPTWLLPNCWSGQPRPPSRLGPPAPIWRCSVTKKSVSR